MLTRVSRSLVVIQNGHHGAGAGVIVREEGVILTNNHVAGQGRLTVGLADGRSLPASVVARRPEFDLALLHVDARGLPVALMADSRNARVGQLVFAVGHPWGQVGYVTAGILTGTGAAQTRDGRTFSILRSDVQLAPGNSGGPLVNAVGAVIGINTMIVGGDQGIAIPSQLASVFLEEIYPAEQAVKIPIAEEVL